MHYSLRLNIVISLCIWTKRKIFKWKRKEKKKKDQRTLGEKLIKMVCNWIWKQKLPLNMEFWYIGSGCNRTCRVASINANVANIHASMQPVEQIKHTQIQMIIIYCLHFMSMKITDNCQWVCPAYATKSWTKSIRFRAAYFPKIIWIPSEWKCYTSDNHANCCKW